MQSLNIHRARAHAVRGAHGGAVARAPRRPRASLAGAARAAAGGGGPVFHYTEIELQTGPGITVHNIQPQLQDLVADLKVRDGFVNVLSRRAGFRPGLGRAWDKGVGGKGVGGKGVGGKGVGGKGVGGKGVGAEALGRKEGAEGFRSAVHPRAKSATGGACERAGACSCRRRPRTRGRPPHSAPDVLKCLLLYFLTLLV
jgi:hypothetical protein